LIERYPVDKYSGYVRQQVWINKANYRIEKINYYDRKNTLLKTLTYTDYKLYAGKYWRPLTMEMVNQQNGKQTILKFSQYLFGINLTQDDFTPNRLKRIR
jgi:outer membrane lipoprotein-sorting protein